MNIQRDPVYVEITKKVLPRYRRLSNNRFDTVTVNGVALDATSIVVQEDLLGLDLLSDPDADRILYWNNSNDTLEWLAPGDHMEISGGQINHLAPGTPSTLSVTSAHYITGIDKDIYGHVTGFTESPLPSENLSISGDSGTGTVDLSSETLNVQGSGDISTSVSGQTIAISSSGSSVSLGTDGQIPYMNAGGTDFIYTCLLYTSPSPRDRQKSRMPSSA